MARLWSWIPILVWAVALVLVASFVWNLWTPPEFLTQPLSLLILLLCGLLGTAIALRKSRTKVRDYNLAAGFLSGQIIRYEVGESANLSVLEKTIGEAEHLATYGTTKY
jgi:hypothetical protein